VIGLDIEIFQFVIELEPELEVVLLVVEHEIEVARYRVELQLEVVQFAVVPIGDWGLQAWQIGPAMVVGVRQGWR
jgi:hypothetical protein